MFVFQVIFVKSWRQKIVEPNLYVLNNNEVPTVNWCAFGICKLHSLLHFERHITKFNLIFITHFDLIESDNVSVQPLISNMGISVVKMEMSVVKKEMSVVKMEMSVVKIEMMSVVKMEMSVVKMEMGIITIHNQAQLYKFKTRITKVRYKKNISQNVGFF